METLAPDQQRVASALAEVYFEVVPCTLRQHCSLTAQISRKLFMHFGIAAELLPCQLWYSAPNKAFVIGFNDAPPAPSRWNGHVVCSVGNWIIDAATHAFSIEFGLKVPSVVVVRRFDLASQVIGQVDLSVSERLWWLHPPQGVDPTPTNEPAAMIEEYSQALIRRLTC